MRPPDLPTIARLRGLLEVAGLVTRGGDLQEALDTLARVVAEALGFRTVVVNLHRPAWDDFRVECVHGDEEARNALLGAERAWTDWEPLLNERYERCGAYWVPAGTYDWSDDPSDSFVPDIAPSDDDEAWDAEDFLCVALRHSDGHVLGTISVDEPLSGRRPSDEDLDVLVAVAGHAALAVEHAQERSEALRHHAALEYLLRVSSTLTGATSAEEVLAVVCEGIADGLGFTRVAIKLLDPETGVYRTRAHAGWPDGAPILDSAVGRQALARLFDYEFEREGCFLLPAAAAHSRYGTGGGPIYESECNGRGARAWNDHWLLVPMHSRAGEVVGYIWPDEPADRLLPTTEILQALRVFANQAATALESAEQVQQLRFLADHDPLTRLPNRRAFLRRAEEEVARCSRYGRSFAVVLLDLDDFKALNDSRGHPAGDAALCTVAYTLLTTLRRPDGAFRLGGDEFALLLAETAGEAADDAVVRLAAALQAACAADGVGASLGAASFPADGTDVETLLRAADSAMYAVKRARHSETA